jgi:hypothetical protein
VSVLPLLYVLPPIYVLPCIYVLLPLPVLPPSVWYPPLDVIPLLAPPGKPRHVATVGCWIQSKIVSAELKSRQELVH